MGNLEINNSLGGYFSGEFTAYHAAQLPDELGMETLRPEPIYVTDVKGGWASSHLDDIEYYELTVVVKKMKVISSKVMFEHLRVVEGVGLDVDAIAYIPEHGDVDNRQILLFNAKEQIKSVTLVEQARCLSYPEESVFNVLIFLHNVTDLLALNAGDIHDHPVVRSAINKHKPIGFVNKPIILRRFKDAILVQYNRFKKPTPRNKTLEELIEEIKALQETLCQD